MYADSHCYVIVLSYSIRSYKAGNYYTFTFTHLHLHTLIRSLERTKATQISEKKTHLGYIFHKTPWIYFLNLLILFAVEKSLEVLKFVQEKVSVIARESFDSGHFELFNFRRAMTTKTSIPRGHEALNTAVNEHSSEFSDFSAANKK